MLVVLALTSVFVLAEVRTLSDLGPYVILFAVGFLVAAWGSSSKAPLAIVFGILLILAAVVLFQLEVSDLPDNPPAPGI